MHDAWSVGDCMLHLDGCEDGMCAEEDPITFAISGSGGYDAEPLRKK